MKSVYITKLSKCLPNTPVANDEMESVLGMVANKPSKARAIVLRNNGIKSRYYAFRDGKSTHTNHELAAIAIKNLFQDPSDLSSIDLIAAGTTSPEQLLPSHAAMIHGVLGTNKAIELLSASGACCSGIQAMKYAYTAVAAGLSLNAVSCGSEKLSSWMHASRFEPELSNLKQLEENPYLAFEKDFLRWMLSDGAGAAFLQPEPATDHISLKIEWIEITSFAHELEVCMYAGGVKDGKELIGWNDLETDSWLDKSVFALKQDTRLLGENIVKLGGEYLATLMQKHSLTSGQVDYFLPHMSSEFFKLPIQEHLRKAGMDLPLDKWFFNLPYVGNVGSASPYLMLEELFHSGKLKVGDRLLVMVPESARFSYAYLYLTVTGPTE